MQGVLAFTRRVPVPVGAAVLAAALVALVVVVVTGGDDKPKIPTGAVALVGDEPITQASLAHWETVYTSAASSASPSKPTEAQARKAAFGLIAGFAWIEQEARRRHVQVSGSQLDTAMKNFFSQYKGATKQQILQQMGAEESDLRAQQRVAMLASALQSKVAKTVPAPTADQVKAAYAADPERWAHPSKRDLRVVFAASQKDARAALAALAGGQSFTTVSKRYSVNQQSATSGGAVKGLQPGSTDATLERAVFSAPQGKLGGPVKTALGWAVFKVQKIVPLPDRALTQASAAIKQELTATARTKAVDKYLADMRDYWRSRTHCVDSVSDKDYCKV